MKAASVPFIDIGRYENGFLEALLPKVEKLLRMTQFVGGEEVALCEQKLTQKSGAAFTLSCANGTDAIQMALRAVGVQKNDCVLIPDMTFWATFESVINVGACPVTLDVDAKTLHLSALRLKQGIEKFRPRAVVLVHLYGWAAPDTLEIRKLCKEHNVTLIEDCAQAFGVLLNGSSLIAGAEIATTSFYPAKVLGASGDAGAVFTQREDWAQVVASLRNHGRSGHYDHAHVGWNSRMGTYEAAFLNIALDHYEARMKSRCDIVEHYRKHLTNLPLQMQSPSTSVKENGYTSVGLVDPSIRVQLIEHFKKENIGFGTIYPGAMSRQAGARGQLLDKIDEGNADRISKSVINLPCFAYMRSDETEHVIQVVRKFFNA